MSNLGNRPLGELELAVMEVVWRDGPLTVWSVQEALAERNAAYTTIMTTMDRLYKKGLLERQKQGHAFSYQATMPREEYERRLVAIVLEGLPARSREALIAGFLDFATASDADGTLDELQRLIDERKRGK